jgi:hypothetical protein
MYIYVYMYVYIYVCTGEKGLACQGKSRGESPHDPKLAFYYKRAQEKRASDYKETKVDEAGDDSLSEEGGRAFLAWQVTEYLLRSDVYSNIQIDMTCDSGFAWCHWLPALNLTPSLSLSLLHYV